MALVLSSRIAVKAEEFEVFPPRLGVENLLRLSLATVTASAEETGGERENAYAEGFTHDFWRPGASGTQWLRGSFGEPVRSNYVAVAAHDLRQRGGSIKMQHSKDGGSTWVDSTDEFAPSDSRPIMLLYDDTTAADHRLVVTSSEAVSLGVVSFGSVIKLPVGIQAPWEPPYLNRENRYVNERSEGGAFIGRSLIAEGTELSLNLKNVDPKWIRRVWEPAVRKMEQYPFFFAARDIAAVGGVAESEVVYAWADRQPTARYSSPMYGEVSLRAKGLIS